MRQLFLILTNIIIICNQACCQVNSLIAFELCSDSTVLNCWVETGEYPIYGFYIYDSIKKEIDFENMFVLKDCTYSLEADSICRMGHCEYFYNYNNRDSTSAQGYQACLFQISAYDTIKYTLSKARLLRVYNESINEKLNSNKRTSKAEEEAIRYYGSIDPYVKINNANMVYQICYARYTVSPTPYKLMNRTLFYVKNNKLKFKKIQVNLYFVNYFEIIKV